MKNYRAVRMIVCALLVLAVLAGTWQSAAAAFIDENHYVQGHTGIFVPAGLDPENMQVTKLHRNEIGWGPVKSIRAIRLDTQFQGGEQTIPTTMTYVFFNLRGGEFRDWQNGNLNIYYQDPNTGNWTTCNAFLVNSDQEQDQEGQNGSDQGNRVACVAPAWNTVYALGTVRPGFENRIQQQTATQGAEGQAEGGTTP